MQKRALLPNKLKKRIILLFFIVTLIFSAIVSTAFLALSQHNEKRLQSIDMGLAIDRIRKQYLNGEDVGRVNRFFHAEKNSATFPDWVRYRAPGFHKVQQDHLIWHVMIVDYPDQRYILLRDYTMFESSRLHTFWLSLFIILGSLLLSLILVWISLHFVIHPIETLEKNIRLKLSPFSKNQLSDSYGEHEIGQLARAFDEVYDKLNHALQRERLFTADVSHELRTPLMVILSSCELLLAQQSFAEKNQQRIHQIQQSAQQILQRLQVYLALARHNSATIPQFSEQSIQHIAHSVIDENQPFAHRHQVVLKLESNGIDTLYPADFCHTILSNLIGNAIEYAGQNSTIRIILQQNGFSVCDDGLGISAEIHPQLFDAFTGTNLGNAHHLGLGLSLVSRICEYLNWHILFSSTPDEGTNFTIITTPLDKT
ncbi:MAG: HAMP domain-containing sensor histidine kinase [Acinetobacter sp.]